MPQLETVPHLLYEKEGNGILWIKFNNPEQLNAAVGGTDRNGTCVKLIEYLRAADDDADVRVIVLTGVGRAFCAGANLRGGSNGFEPAGDVPGMAPYPGPEGVRQMFFHGVTKLVKEIAYVRKPTVAMMNGVAAGFGMDLALQCDIRYGCEHTRFLGYQGIGQIIENGGAYYLPKLAGLGRALEFAYTGDLDAQRAYEWGILNRLVPSAELEQEVRALCERMMKVPPVSQWINKRIIRAAAEGTLEATAVLTSNAASILHGSEDAKEARAAFVEKRAPVFKGTLAMLGSVLGLGTMIITA